MITGLPHYPEWRVGDGIPRKLVYAERRHGVRLIRAKHYVPATQNALRRAIYEATFGFTALLASRRVARPDAILGIVPSLSGGVLARLLGQRTGAPYGLLFQDLMGPAAGQSGIAGGGAVARATTAAERWTTGRARAVGVVATSFDRYLLSLRGAAGPDRARAKLEPQRRTRPVDRRRARTLRLDGRTAGRPPCREHGPQAGPRAGHRRRATSRPAQPSRSVRLLRRRKPGGRDAARGSRPRERGLHRVAARRHPCQPAGRGRRPPSLGATVAGGHEPSEQSSVVLRRGSARPDGGRPWRGQRRRYRRAGRCRTRRAGGTAPETFLAALTRLRDRPALAAELAAAGRVYAARTHTAASDCLASASALMDRITTVPTPVVRGVESIA